MKRLSDTVPALSLEPLAAEKRIQTCKIIQQNQAIFNDFLLSLLSLEAAKNIVDEWYTRTGVPRPYKP